MTTALIFLLLLATSLLLRHQLLKAKVVLFITILFFYLIGSGVVSYFLLPYLEVYEPLSHPIWKKNNAIVLLGAGTVRLQKTHEIKPTVMAYSRIHETARLYYACKKTKEICLVIISGGDALATGQTEAAVYQAELTSINVKKEDIVLEVNSMNTYKNAEFTSAIIKTKKIDNAVLVTSGIHMQRSLLYFSHFGINAIPAASDYISPTLLLIPFGYNFEIADFALHEFMGILRYYFYNYTVLNVKSV